MRERRRKFTPEFKDEAVKMVTESSRPIAEVAREIQVNEGTLGSWVNKYRVEQGPGVVARCPICDGLTVSDSEGGEGVVVVVQVAAGVGDVGASGQAQGAD